MTMMSKILCIPFFYNKFGMDFDKRYIDELIDIREESRKKNNWGMSDDIRNYLDSKSVFIIDSKEGQIVHFMVKGTTRKDLTDRKNEEIRIDKVIDAWIYTQNKKMKK